VRNPGNEPIPVGMLVPRAEGYGMRSVGRTKTRTRHPARRARGSSDRTTDSAGKQPTQNSLSPVAAQSPVTTNVASLRKQKWIERDRRPALLHRRRGRFASAPNDASRRRSVSEITVTKPRTTPPRSPSRCARRTRRPATRSLRLLLPDSSSVDCAARRRAASSSRADGSGSWPRRASAPRATACSPPSRPRATSARAKPSSASSTTRDGSRAPPAACSRS
jgi:hypothetical protein